MGILDPDTAALFGLNDPPDATDPDRVTAAVLGQWLGLTSAHVNRLAREGILPRDPAGAFPLRESVAAYVGHLRTSARGRSLANPDLAAEKVRLTKAQADQAEAKAAVARGELVQVGEVTATWATICADLRAALLAVPGRVDGLDRAVAQAVDREIRSALEALSDDR